MIKTNKFILVLLLFVLIALLLYPYSPRKLEYIGHYNKVFAHRVNSIAKLKSSLLFFKGIELDLVYKKQGNILDVNHPPAPSQNLNFETYLKHIEKKTFPFLWLDIKNLNISNAKAIIIKLNKLLATKNYPKNQVLIETSNPETLPIFTKTGYKTSYYLPTQLFKNKDLKSKIREIKLILKKQPKIGISSSYKDYPILKSNFPNKTKYIWALIPNLNRKYKQIRTLLNDDKVAVVLCRYKVFSGND